MYWYSILILDVFTVYLYYIYIFMFVYVYIICMYSHFVFRVYIYIGNVYHVYTYIDILPHTAHHTYFEQNLSYGFRCGILWACMYLSTAQSCAAYSKSLSPHRDKWIQMARHKPVSFKVMQEKYSQACQQISTGPVALPMVPSQSPNITRNGGCLTHRAIPFHPQF